MVWWMFVLAWFVMCFLATTFMFITGEIKGIVMSVKNEEAFFTVLAFLSPIVMLVTLVELIVVISKKKNKTKKKTKNYKPLEVEK